MKKMHHKNKIENDMGNDFSKERKKQEEEKQERIRESQLLRDGGSSLDLFLEMFVGIPGFKRYTEAY